MTTVENEPYIYENDDINWVSSKQPPKQLLHVNPEKSSILLSNSTRNPKSGVAYKKKKSVLDFVLGSRIRKNIMLLSERFKPIKTFQFKLG